MLLAVGSVSTVAGMTLLFRPVLGGGQFVLVVVVIVLLVAAGTVSVSRLSTPRQRPEPPRTGEESETRVPGDAFDRQLDSLSAHSARGADERAAVREQLRELAVDRVVAETGCSRTTARERLDAGTWTDDPVAAALFTGESPSTRAYLRALLGGQSAFERRVERVIDILSERSYE